MYTEKKSLGDLLLVEVHRGWSRQKGTLASLSGAAAPLGTVLAKVSGKYHPIDFAGTGGAEIPAAVLVDDLDAVSDDTDVVVLPRGATVNVAALVWPAGATTLQKAAAIAHLETLGIVARDVL